MTVLDLLNRRERIPELMDDPGIDPAAHRAALAGLARINRLSCSADLLWPPIRKLMQREPTRTLRVLDVATGSGDVPRALARRGDTRLEVAGCDISPTAIQDASEQAVGRGIRFFTHDAIRDPLPSGFDVVTCSLFLHHLSEADAVTLLRRMKDAAEELVLVNDLERSRLGFALAWVGTRLLSSSPVVRYDGPASVRSALTPKEALRLADEAGLHGATVGRRWPCRYLLSWRKR